MGWISSNWGDWGAGGRCGVAVIGSLIFVAVQVRYSNAINRAESVCSFVRDYNTDLYRALQNEVAALGS